jgi:8-oxo-dGTP diphosphatase
MRVVSVAYLGLMPNVPRPRAGTDAADARFWSVSDLGTQDGPTLAFDHDRIVADGVERARSRLEYTSLATSFVEEPFTIADLRRVYETVWGIALHQANFRRKVLSTDGLVVPTGQERSTGRGWTQLYRRGGATQLHPPILRQARTNAHLTLDG